MMTSVIYIAVVMTTKSRTRPVQLAKERFVKLSAQVILRQRRHREV